MQRHFHEERHGGLETSMRNNLLTPRTPDRSMYIRRNRAPTMAESDLNYPAIFHPYAYRRPHSHFGNWVQRSLFTKATGIQVWSHRSATCIAWTFGRRGTFHALVLILGSALTRPPAGAQCSCVRLFERSGATSAHACPDAMSHRPSKAWWLNKSPLYKVFLRKTPYSV